MTPRMTSAEARETAGQYASWQVAARALMRAADALAQYEAEATARPLMPPPPPQRVQGSSGWWYERHSGDAGEGQYVAQGDDILLAYLHESTDSRVPPADRALVARLLGEVAHV
jgi:hypothetical protein